MPDIDDLIRNLRQFRATVVRDIPRQLGQEMLEQTHESFKEERFAGSPVNGRIVRLSAGKATSDTPNWITTAF